MSLFERMLGRKLSQEPARASAPDAQSLQTVPSSPEIPLPAPEVIALDTHPLRFYPGFKNYASDWNIHATTDSRLGLQADIASAQFALAKDNKESVALQARLKR